MIKFAAILSDYSRLHSNSLYRLISPSDLNELCAKIQTCFEAKEPFGLDSKDSSYIISTRDNVAILYADGLSDGIPQQMPHQQSMMFLVSSILTTHHHFVGPIGVHKFLLSHKILNDD